MHSQCKGRFPKDFGSTKPPPDRVETTWNVKSWHIMTVWLFHPLRLTSKRIVHRTGLPSRSCLEMKWCLLYTVLICFGTKSWIVRSESWTFVPKVFQSCHEVLCFSMFFPSCQHLKNTHRNTQNYSRRRFWLTNTARSDDLRAEEWGCKARAAKHLKRCPRRPTLQGWAEGPGSNDQMPRNMVWI